MRGLQHCFHLQRTRARDLNFRIPSTAIDTVILDLNTRKLVVGAVAAAGVLALIATGKAGFNLAASGFAANGFGEHSPGGYTLLACFVCEVVLTFFFLIIILGSTEPRAPAGFAPIAIGLGLTLIHLISIPVTNTSVNPARSLGPAVFVGGWALSQLWLFWVAPIIGAVLAGLIYPLVAGGLETYGDS
jgi:aquaporin Z